MSSVGIIVPCYNQSQFAADCIASLEAQTWRDWRAVLIDDASTEPADLTSLASERVRVVRLERNLGRALVRNEGVRLLGEVDYVLNVDCDDALTPDYVERLVAALDADSALGLAYGTLRYFGGPHPTGRDTWPPRDFSLEHRFVENVIPGAGAMVRRMAFAQTSGWRQAFTKCGAEDYDFWLQVVELGWGVLWVRHAEYLYRQHPSSFLARSGEKEQVEQALTLLRFHHRSIRRSSGLSNFLAPQVMPALYRALRTARMREAIHILAPLLRFAPDVTMKLAARYYTRPRSPGAAS